MRWLDPASFHRMASRSVFFTEIPLALNTVPCYHVEMARGGFRAGAGRPIKGGSLRVRMLLQIESDLAVRLKDEADRLGKSSSDLANEVLRVGLAGIENRPLESKVPPDPAVPEVTVGSSDAAAQLLAKIRADRERLQGDFNQKPGYSGLRAVPKPVKGKKGG